MLHTTIDPPPTIKYEIAQKPIRRGQIWIADLGLSTGSLQSGKRPFLILSNNIGNKFSPVIWGFPITSQLKKLIPTHVQLDASEFGLAKNSIILCEQPMTLDKWMLEDHVATLNNEKMKEVELTLLVSAGICI